MQIEPEAAADATAIHAVHTAAFPTPDEAALVDALRDSAAYVPALSLVARCDGRVVGHVLLTEVRVREHPSVSALTLAPIAVEPAAQGRGIGSRLVRAGLDAAQEHGYGVVFLHGSPAFYPRFGFEPAADRGFENPFPLPDEDFMYRDLGNGLPDDAGGPLVYPAAFDDV